MKKLLLSLILMVACVGMANAAEKELSVLCSYAGMTVAYPLSANPTIIHEDREDGRYAVVYLNDEEALAIALSEGGSVEMKFDALVANKVTLSANDGNSYYGTLSSTMPVFVEFKANVLTVRVSGTKLKLDTSTFFGKDVVEEIDGRQIRGTWIPANTGVLLKSYTDNLYVWSRTVGDLDPITNVNYLRPATQEMEEEGYKFYMLAYGDEALTPSKLGFYWGNEDGSAFVPRKGSAYLAVPEDVAAKGFCFNDEATAIQNVNADENATIYNLQGQRVSGSQKGIVIVNGKKHVNN